MKNVFSHPLPCEKIALNLLYFYQQIISFFSLLIVIQNTIVIQKKSWVFIYLIIFRLNVAKNGLKNLKVVIINPLQNKPNTFKSNKLEKKRE